MIARGNAPGIVQPVIGLKGVLSNQGVSNSHMTISRASSTGRCNTSEPVDLTALPIMN